MAERLLHLSARPSRPQVVDSPSRSNPRNSLSKQKTALPRPPVPRARGIAMLFFVFVALSNLP